MFFKTQIISPYHVIISLKGVRIRIGQKSPPKKLDPEEGTLYNEK
jgi:hypothetical protein